MFGVGECCLFGLCYVFVVYVGEGVGVVVYLCYYVMVFDFVQCM